MAINLSITLVVFWTLIVKRFAIGELPMNYYICLGIDPNKDKGPEYYQSSPKKYNASLILWILCTLLHIFMWPKIFLYRRKAEKNAEPIELGSFNKDSEKKQNGRRRRHHTQSNSPLRQVMITKKNKISYHFHNTLKVFIVTVIYIEFQLIIKLAPAFFN